MSSPLKTKIKLLQEAMPEIACPSGCTRCCGPVEIAPEEARDLGLKENNTGISPCGDCALKTETGCSVYGKRPLICRLFGTGKDGTPMSCHIRRQAGFPEGEMTMDDQIFVLDQFFKELVVQGVRDVDDNILFACHEHDVREGFRTDADLRGVLLERYENWKKQRRLAAGV